MANKVEMGIRLCSQATRGQRGADRHCAFLRKASPPSSHASYCKGLKCHFKHRSAPTATSGSAGTPALSFDSPVPTTEQYVSDGSIHSGRTSACATAYRLRLAARNTGPSQAFHLVRWPTVQPQATEGSCTAALLPRRRCRRQSCLQPCSTGRVTYGSEAEAKMVMGALEVDAEVRAAQGFEARNDRTCGNACWPLFTLRSCVQRR